jgi:hypothetical protein
VTPEDLAVRHATYRLFVELGRAPQPGEVAATTGGAEPEVLASWRRLHVQHALVLDDSGRSIRMANPFAGVPTAYRVRVEERRWYANCAWDAFGVCAALGADGRIETRCRDCDDPLTVEVRDRQPDDRTLVFHCLVPARSWWEDIGFT